MRVLVLYAHPVETSYQSALHERVVHGLGAAGHQVDDCDLYAEDFADFFVALTERNWQGVSTFNLASQRLCSINDLCAMLEKVTGRRLSLEYAPERGVDLRGLEIDSRAAKQALGWQATTKLEEGLVKTWEWFVQSQ